MAMANEPRRLSLGQFSTTTLSHGRPSQAASTLTETVSSKHRFSFIAHSPVNPSPTKCLDSLPLRSSQEHASTPRGPETSSVCCIKTAFARLGKRISRRSRQVRETRRPAQGRTPHHVSPLPIRANEEGGKGSATRGKEEGSRRGKEAARTRSRSQNSIGSTATYRSAYATPTASSHAPSHNVRSPLLSSRTLWRSWPVATYQCCFLSRTHPRLRVTLGPLQGIHT
jgi:hypothetical protein